MPEISKSIAGLLAVGVLGAAPSAAQQAAESPAFGPTLTAAALVDRVLGQNAGLAAVDAAAEAAAYRIEPAGSRDDPMLSIGAAPRSSEHNVEFSQRLPWPGTLSARENAARHAASAADWSVDAQRLALAAAAKQAYAEWYFVARALEIHHEVQTLLEDLIATAEVRYAAGRALQQDVLQAEVERAELETEELRLRRQQTAARARINALLNRTAGAPLPPAAGIDIVRPALDRQALERLALERHPELERLDAEIAAASSRVTVARKGFFPGFQVHAGYNALWDDADKRPMLGVSINVPLDRGKRQADLDRAQAEMRRAEFTLSDERARLLADIARARAEVVESVESIAVYEDELLPLAEAYLNAAVADYQSGTGAFLNVVTAEQRLLSTELNLVRARADYVRRLAELERLTGGPFEAAAGAQGEQQ